MRKTKAIVVAVLICILFISLMSACGNKSASVIVVAGSTSMQPYAEVLAEAYELCYPGCEIDIQGGGSFARITAAESGIADIGMSSRVLKNDEQALWFAEIAKDGLVIIINPKNPIRNLTLEQIRAVYTSEITNWSELGGANAKIHIISREEGSGTRSAFEELVMDKNPVTPKAIVQDSNGTVKQLVSNDPNAVGFISLGLVDETVKALLLEDVEASYENVMNGSYSLFRSFLFVTVGEPLGLTKQFIDFTLSPEGQKMLMDEGLISGADG